MEFFGNWAEKSARYAWTTLSWVIVIFVASTWLTLTQIKFETDHAALVSRDEPFWGPQNELLEKFPQLDRTAVVVIEADTVDLVDAAADALATRLRAEPEIFASVFHPTEDPFFDKNAFMFLELEELSDVVDKLADAQPALAAVSQDPNLRGFFDLIDTGLTAMENGTDLPPAFADLITETAKAVENHSEGKPVNLSWANEMMGDNEMALRRILTVKATLGEKQAASERRVVSHIREIAKEPQFNSDNGVTIRVTGVLGMQYDELDAIKKGVGLAGVLSLIFLAIILMAGLPSWRMIIAVYLTLFAGLQWTMGFAAITIGSLNMMSAAFAVLFVGLGVDHALHICLRYNEYLANGEKHLEAIRKAATTTGGAVALCALTSAIGFAAFIPTSYLGIAQLGLIAAGGMGFALIATLTVMPAILTILRAGKRPMREPKLKPSPGMLQPRRRFAVLGVVIGLAAIYYVDQTGLIFNFSSMSIRDPGAESVSTIFELQEDGVETDFVATILAKNRSEALKFAKELEALPEVSEARSPYDYVSDDQEEKLYVIEDATTFLWPALQVNESPEVLTDSDRLAVIDEFIEDISKLKTEDKDTLTALQRLSKAFVDAKANASDPSDLADLEKELLKGVLRQLDRLRDALQADYFEFKDLPENLRARLISSDGTHRVTAIPENDIKEVGPLRQFVDAVQSVSTRVTGRPVVESGVGSIVVSSFIQAGTTAIVAITLLLLVFFRNIRETLLVLIPILLAGVLMVGTMNLLGLSFNFGNVIALPLIFGLGVDSSIHLVLRARETHSAAAVASSSTPQAILLSSLTTIAAFASLSFSPHWGIASIGVSLTIGILWLLVCTLLVLPGLLRLGAKD
jgi:uncharacterized protein